MADGKAVWTCTKCAAQVQTNGPAPAVAGCPGNQQQNIPAGTHIWQQVVQS